MKQSTLLLGILLILTFSCKNSPDKGSNNSEKSAKETVADNNISNVLEQKNNPVSKNVKSEEADKTNMVFFEGGTFLMGRNNGLPQEGPAHKVTIKPFYIDKYPVTVREFREFISETGHVTEAERFGDSGVFDFNSGQWSLKPKTTWEYPFGPDGEKAHDDHPVTHVSWRDAVTFAKWTGKRLVTEAEWEYAARNGGKITNNYPWGNEPKMNGKWMANVFQGEIQETKVEDGYLYTSPVGKFGLSEAGLADMCGNVWEWMSDTYRPYPGSNVPFNENTEVKTTRGGSFMFDAVGADSYTVFFRSSNSAETSLFNTGFRCALSAN